MTATKQIMPTCTHRSRRPSLGECTRSSTRLLLVEIMAEMGRYLVLVIMTAGCIEPSLVVCGDLACPAGSVCLSPNRCVSPPQLASCAHLGESDPCFVDGAEG